MNLLIVGHRSLMGRRLMASMGKDHTFVKAGRPPGADIQFDLFDESDAIGSIPKCDALIHCAASFGPDTLEGAALNERINSLGCFRVAKLAELAGCSHIVYLASISSERHRENEYYGTYGISKAHGEDNLSLCCRLAGMRFTSLRLSQIYDDAGEARGHQPLFYHIIDRAKKGKEIVFYGNKDPLRNFLYIDDVVTIIERILITQTVGFYPVLFPTSYTLSEIAVLAFKAFAKEARIQFLANKPDMKTIYLPPTASDLYERLQYTPITDLEVGMAKICEAMSGAGKERLYAHSS